MNTIAVLGLNRKSAILVSQAISILTGIDIITVISYNDLSIMYKLDGDMKKWGCFDCKYFPICATTCPWNFIDNKEERRCTKWKDINAQQLIIVIGW